MDVCELCMTLANNNICFINKIKRILLHACQFMYTHSLAHTFPHYILLLFSFASYSDSIGWFHCTTLYYKVIWCCAVLFAVVSSHLSNVNRLLFSLCFFTSVLSLFLVASFDSLHCIIELWKKKICRVWPGCVVSIM